MYKISATVSFAAAHNLRGYEGACEQLHGHNWLVKATLATEKLDTVGIAYDFKKLKQKLNDIIDRFDHQFLNQIPPFDQQLNPTSENLAHYIFIELAKKLPPHIQVFSIEVGESHKYTATYQP
ncbi:MAG: 6-carboxytetrahydropterin synthase QueD [bacterium]|nr:6-carboxytetrahydropterin synthase QueD [bacterium]